MRVAVALRAREVMKVRRLNVQAPTRLDRRAATLDPYGQRGWRCWTQLARLTCHVHRRMVRV